RDAGSCATSIPRWATATPRPGLPAARRAPSGERSLLDAIGSSFERSPPRGGGLLVAGGWTGLRVPPSRRRARPRLRHRPQLPVRADVDDLALLELQLVARLAGDLGVDRHAVAGDQLEPDLEAQVD